MTHLEPEYGEAQPSPPSGQQHAGRALRNSVWLLVANAFKSGTRLILLLFIARLLGKEGFGAYGVLISFAEIFLFVAEQGLANITIREMARDLECTGRHLANALLLRTGVLVLTFTIAMAIFRAQSNDAELLVALGLYFLGQGLSLIGDLFDALFQAHQRMQFVTLTVGVYNVLNLVGTLAVLLKWHSLPPLLAVTAIAGLGKVTVAIYITLSRFARLHLHTSLADVFQLLKESAFVGVSSMLIGYLWRVAILVSNYVLTEGDSALLYGPVRAIQQSRIVAYALLGSVFPVLSATATANRERFNLWVVRSIRAVGLIGLLSAVLVASLAKPLSLILFGPEMRDAAETMQVLAWVIAVSFINRVLGGVLVAAGRQALEMWSLAAGLLIAVPLSWWFESLWGPVGGGIALLVAEVLILVLLLLFSKLVLRLNSLLAFISRLTLTLGLGAGCVVLLQGQSQVIILGICLTTTLATGWILRVVRREEVRWLIDIVRKMTTELALNRKGLRKA
jgi:O-antigen/teichoic acid export membrane protein